MKATKNAVAALSAALVICIAATAGLLLTGRDAPEDGRQSIYYFTNYAAPELLAAASVENETGSIVLAQSNGKYYAMTDDISGSDGAAVAAFFEAACHISLSQALEGVSSLDAQYGLTAPRAEITLQDVNGGGLVFRLGNVTPDEAGVYACLTGDERVFIMEHAQAGLYLSNINQFLDLTLYPSLDDSAVKTLAEIEVCRDGKTRYRLRQVYANEDGSTVYYAMAAPWKLLLGANQAKANLLTPLRQLKGVSVSKLTSAQSGLAVSSDWFRLTWQDGSSTTVLVGNRTEETTPVMAAGSGRVVYVPTASLSFMDADAIEIIGKNLLSLNINDLDTLTLNGRHYAVRTENGAVNIERDGAVYDAAAFQNTIFAALNRISIQGPYTEEAPAGEVLLHIEIATHIASETIDLAFYRLDGRKCAVSVNGQMAVWCDLAAVRQLLNEAG